MSELTVQESRTELQKVADEVAEYYTTDAMIERNRKELLVAIRGYSTKEVSKAILNKFGIFNNGMD